MRRLLIKIMMLSILVGVILRYSGDEAEAKATVQCEYVNCFEKPLLSRKACVKHICKVEMCKEVGFVVYDRYCRYHKDPEAREDLCEIEKCDKLPVGGSGYCFDHKCKSKWCRNLAAPNSSGYCKTHIDIKMQEYREKWQKEMEEQEVKKNSKYTSYSYSSKKKKSSMPDCDDYDSYEEFMDDWDGYMPDGSDAEDYWENW